MALMVMPPGALDQFYSQLVTGASRCTQSWGNICEYWRRSGYQGTSQYEIRWNDIYPHEWQLSNGSIIRIVSYGTTPEYADTEGINHIRQFVVTYQGQTKRYICFGGGHPDPTKRLLVEIVPVSNTAGAAEVKEAAQGIRSVLTAKDTSFMDKMKALTPLQLFILWGPIGGGALAVILAILWTVKNRGRNN